MYGISFRTPAVEVLSLNFIHTFKALDHRFGRNHEVSDTSDESCQTLFHRFLRHAFTVGFVCLRPRCQIVPVRYNAVPSAPLHTADASSKISTISLYPPPAA